MSLFCTLQSVYVLSQVACGRNHKSVLVVPDLPQVATLQANQSRIILETLWFSVQGGIYRNVAIAQNKGQGTEVTQNIDKDTQQHRTQAKHNINTQ